MRLHEEGCLSIPDVHVEIERPSSLTLRYLDRNGKPQELHAEGLLAPPSSMRSIISTVS